MSYNVTSLLLGGHGQPAFRSQLAAGRRRSRPCLAESSCLRIEIAPISGIQTVSISRTLVHAIVEIRVLRSRAVSASRSHQFQGYKPCQYPNSSCTHSLKSVSCGVELSPHRGRTNIKDTNRINIPFLVHAIVEIRVLRSRAVSASRPIGYKPCQLPRARNVEIRVLRKLSPHRDRTNFRDANRVNIPILVHAIVEIRVLRSRAVSASRSHQYQGYKPCQYPNSSCTQSLKSVSCGVELSPHRDRTNIRDTNRVNIPSLVHALVEIRVLRSRAVSASRSHQFQGYKPCQYPNSSCTHSLKSVSCGVELSPHRGRTNIKDTNRVNIPIPRARTR